MTQWFRQAGECVTLSIYVQPGAKKTEVAGLHGDALKIRIKAPPVEGQANALLCKYLAERFAVPLRAVTLKAGDLSRNKVVEICGSRVIPASLLEQ